MDDGGWWVARKLGFLRVKIKKQISVRFQILRKKRAHVFCFFLAVYIYTSKYSSLLTCERDGRGFFVSSANFLAR